MITQLSSQTDGLVDNVYPEEILEICSVVLQEHRHDHDRPQIMSDRIVDYARQCMRSKTLLTPFERESWCSYSTSNSAHRDVGQAIKQGVAHKGGVSVDSLMSSRACSPMPTASRKLMSESRFDILEMFVDFSSSQRHRCGYYGRTLASNEPAPMISLVSTIAHLIAYVYPKTSRR